MTKHEIPVEPFRPEVQTEQDSLLDASYGCAKATAFTIHQRILDPLVLRPIRALAFAYSYVIRGEKVETPIRWTDI